jgi:hypothetical protein
MSFRLRRRPHHVVLIAHVLTSVGWWGVALLVAIGGITAAVTGDPTLAHSLHQVMQTSPYLTITLGLTSVLTGGLLGLGTRFGLIRYWWVVIKIAISVAVIMTDALLIPRVAATATATGLAPIPLFGASIAHVVLLGVATGLSVLKPKARTPWAARSPASPSPSSRSPSPARPRVPEGAVS